MNLNFNFIDNRRDILDNTTAEYKAIKAMKVEEFIDYQEMLKSNGCRVMYVSYLDAYKVYEYIHKAVPNVRFRIQFNVRRVTV
jgi:hypothetical protein